MKLKYLLCFFIAFTMNINLFADNYTDKLDAMMSSYDKQGLFSGVVLLAKDGNIAYEKSYGYADWENKIANNNKTLFNTASITKMFTFTLISQLNREGKLSLDDPLNKYLSMYPEEIGSKITIKMLVDMKAGLGDFLRNPDFNRNPEKFTTINDYLELIKNESLLFEPGAKFEYSNSGFAVLGGVIEKVTGKSYAENLKERIFEPLGMSDTYYKQYNDKISNSAVPTQISFTNEKRTMPDMTSPSPAGGIYINIEDMLKFDEYLKSTKILNAGARAGGTPGWNSVWAQYRNGYTLIVMSNFGRAAEEVEKRFRQIMETGNFDEPSLPIGMKMYKILKENGTEELEKNLKSIIEASDLEYNDMHLNKFGYELMQSGDLDLALEIFKINAKLFPDIANVYDSLGEIYMNKGEKQLAIENYKKVLVLRPQNQIAKEMVEKLQGN